MGTDDFRLRSKLRDRINHSLSLMGHAEMSDALAAQVKRHAEYLGRCSQESEAVLSGDAGAADRLWLLLREPPPKCPGLPRSILDEITKRVELVEPRALDGQILLRLIAGVVRAANQPVEAELMLDSLTSLLEPLFVCDLLGAAALRADRASLQTLVTAWSSPRWREVLKEDCLPKLRDTVNEAQPVRSGDRLPFDPNLWREAHHIDEFPLWKTWICPGGVRLGMSRLDPFAPRYTLESISNPGACKGEMITIRGRDFGPAGRVYFPSPDIDDPAFSWAEGDAAVLVGVEPRRWTDTEIDVVVPKWATSGQLHLNAYTRHEDPCTTIDVFRFGNTIPFEGGMAGVFEVSVAGKKVDLSSKEPTLLIPKDSVALTWRASVGPTVRVGVKLIISGEAETVGANLAGGFGGLVLTVPDKEPHQPKEGILEFTAVSACGAVQPLRIPVLLSVPPKLSIQYIEVTQGVQVDLGEVLAGHAMPMVALKDTAVRVHMHCDRGGWYYNKLENITGALWVDGRQLGPTNKRQIPPMTKGFASIQGFSNPEHTDDTLNFTVPGAWLTPGSHNLALRIVCNDPAGKIVLNQSLTWTWFSKSPLRVRAIYMELYPPLEFMLDYTRQALDFLPTPLTDIGIAHPSGHIHNYDLSTKDGWHDLVEDLEDLWDDFDEDSDVRWLGIVPDNERFVRPSIALGGTSGVPSIAVLAMGDMPHAAAHELGHSLGLNHVNQPPGGPDGPYDTVDNGGMLRRPPFDVRASKAVLLPTVDLMAYGKKPRPGITTWLRLFNKHF